MSRAEKIEDAIREESLPVYRGRAVGMPCQLARLADVAQSTVRYAYCSGAVRAYELRGAALMVDADDLARHFRTSRPGRKPLVAS